LGSEFIGLHPEEGRVLPTRILLDSGRRKELSLVVARGIPSNGIAMPCEVGASVRHGRGTLRIKRIEETKDGYLKIWVDSTGDSYSQFGFTPIGMDGKPILRVDNLGRPTDEPDVFKRRNGMGNTGNTNGKNPAVVGVARRYIDQLRIDVNALRYYEVYGVPANPN